MSSLFGKINSWSGEEGRDVNHEPLLGSNYSNWVHIIYQEPEKNTL